MTKFLLICALSCSTAIYPVSHTSELSLREQRNLKIRDEYTRMFHKEGKRNEVILELLSKKYFLAEDTVERIIYQRGRYRATTDGAASLKQYELFEQP